MRSIVSRKGLGLLTRVCVCLCVCVSVCRPKVSVRCGVFLYHTPPYSLRQVLLLNLEPSSSAKPIGRVLNLVWQTISSLSQDSPSPGWGSVVLLAIDFISHQSSKGGFKKIPGERGGGGARL